MSLFGQSKIAASIDGTGMRMLACNGRAVRWWADLPLDQRLFRQGFLADGRGFAQAMAASDKVGKTKGRVVAAMPGFQHFFRILSVPKVARKQLAAIVTGEVRRSMPDADRNVFTFWQPLGRGDGLQLSVCVLAVPRQPLVNFLEAMRAVKLGPSVLDLRPLALARVVNRQDAIIANSEAGSIDVVIVQNDLPVVMRSIYLGDDFNDLDYVNHRLLDELARTVAHFNATSQGGSLATDTPVFLTGRGASDPRMPPAIEETTQHSVLPLEPPFDYPAEFPVAEFAVQLGLMLK